MELNAGTEVYKVLDQRQLAASPATIYTAPASTEAFIKAIKVVNNDTVPRSFQMFRGGTALANAITPTFWLVPKGMAIFQELEGWRFYDPEGHVERAFGSILRSGSEPFYGLTGHLAESIPRIYCTETNTTPPVSGTLVLMPIYLKAGMIIQNISYHSATTAAGTPTHWLFGLYDRNQRRLAVSADQLTAAWAANTLKTLAVTPVYLVPASGIYYVGFMMTATAVCSLKGNTGRNASQLLNRIQQLAGTTTPNLVSALPTVAAPILATVDTYWCSVS
jgi:hypothetical protein